MEQYTFFQPKNTLVVSQLTTYLRELLSSDPILQDIWVEGEISNLSRPASGHLYFTLKDSQAAVRCVMWRNAAQRLDFALREGSAVLAHGSMGVYEVSGQVQLYVDTMRPAGEGALYQEFLRLKAKLEAEGLFDSETKRPLPPMPKRIGIVTSPTGAALQDMLDTIRRRYPVAEVVLSPTLVQGADAPAGIVTALTRLNQEENPDVIVIGRGGGSIEDLWAFNDEAVARAVAASGAPIISGVGHETDFTLTDFAADRRAPTPTAAAEVATPDRLDLLAAVAELSNRQTANLRERLTDLRWEVGQLTNALSQQSPAHRVDTYRQRLDEISLRLERGMQARLDRTRLRLDHAARSLQSLNPAAVLNRGYAIVTRTADGSLVRQADQVKEDESIHIRVSQGSLDARVSKINQEQAND
ncbi:exodeoxyribonuclease VII large subunit [bacterium]|nr:exodeoxyribonuclease VII large subunit [bacterium]